MSERKWISIVPCYCAFTIDLFLANPKKNVKKIFLTFLSGFERSRFLDLYGWGLFILRRNGIIVRKTDRELRILYLFLQHTRNRSPNENEKTSENLLQPKSRLSSRWSFFIEIISTLVVSPLELLLPLDVSNSTVSLHINLLTSK